jgi:hypothetical protein
MVKSEFLNFGDIYLHLVTFTDICLPWACPGLAPIYWTRIFDDYSRGPLLSNSTGDR